MFGDPAYSDATIYIHGMKLPVHKIILCTQCEEIEELFCEKFNQGKKYVLSFNEGSGAAYWRVFEFLYKGDYSDQMPVGLEGKKPCLSTILYIGQQLTG
jgi:hypothetical protein